MLDPFSFFLLKVKSHYHIILIDLSSFIFYKINRKQKLKSFKLAYTISKHAI